MLSIRLYHLGCNRSFSKYTIGFPQRGRTRILSITVTVARLRRRNPASLSILHLIYIREHQVLRLMKELLRESR
jgi:hypothetical protein